MIKANESDINDRNSSAQLVLLCPNLAEALDFFTRRLGFRIEMIAPADSPRIAVISDDGLTLRLEAETEVRTPPDNERGFVVNRQAKDDPWIEGRAGMQYRDLIPGRLGGRLIASHIRIPDGGKTPDYVHYHKLRFQLIYCKAGWVMLVYEDQGAPFILNAGDCVMQPPEIRHRVLESSPGAEVVEIACPAVHETYADHEMELPTSRILPERLYGDQRFVLHRANETQWTPTADGFESRDTGITTAINGLAVARLVRPSLNRPIDNFASRMSDIRPAGEFLFRFILKGELTIDQFDNGTYQLHEGDSCVIPSEFEYGLSVSADLEMFEVGLQRSLIDSH